MTSALASARNLVTRLAGIVPIGVEKRATWRTGSSAGCFVLARPPARSHARKLQFTRILDNGLSTSSARGRRAARWVLRREWRRDCVATSAAE